MEKNLIVAALEEKPSEFMDIFNNAMRERLIPALGEYKADIASSMFDVQEESEQLDESVTRKHFRMVAEIIKGYESQDKRNELAHHHAEIFAKQNPRFDREKFFKAANATTKLTKEDVGSKQLDEISKKTLGSYINRASEDRKSIANLSNRFSDAKESLSSGRHKSDGYLRNKLYGTSREARYNVMDVEGEIGKTIDRLSVKDSNRQRGIYKATKRLTKEDADSES